jgi:hypothetical protein
MYRQLSLFDDKCTDFKYMKLRIKACEARGNFVA